jgi:DNA repair exonuclease SbcCD ATPase subunit
MNQPDLQPIVDQLTATEQRLQAHLNKINKEAEQLRTQLARVQAAIKSLAGMNHVKSQSGKATSPVRKKVPTDQQLIEMIRKLIQSNPSSTADGLHDQLNAHLTQHRYARHGLRAKLNKLLATSHFSIDSSGVVSVT